MVRKIGYKHSEESKEKMKEAAIKQIESKTRKGLFTVGHKRGMIGKHHNEDSKIKISKSNIGKNKGREGYWRGKKNVGTSIRNILNNPIKNKEVRKKVSVKNKGKHFSKETEFKEGEFIGEKHYNWQGGKSFEPYDITFDNNFKRAIRKRDNQICMLCGIHREKLYRALHIHHVNYDKKLSIPQNCISLCISCHIKTNYNRNNWTNFFQSLLSERYGYEYNNSNEVIFKQMEISELNNGG